MFDQAKTDDPPIDHGRLLDVLARADVARLMALAETLLPLLGAT